jgi:hypothetical protein
MIKEKPFALSEVEGLSCLSREKAVLRQAQDERMSGGHP